MGPRRVAALALTLSVGLAGCENSLGPDSVRSIQVDIDGTTLVEGGSTGISVSATDVQGGSISNSEVTWISRDPTTVRVEDGQLIGVAPGVTTVVADVRGARDSVRIRVRFANLARGEIGVRLQGDRGIRQATGGTTYVRRFLNAAGLPTTGAITSIRTYVGEDAESATGTVNPLAATDTLVWITYSGEPQIGPRRLGSFVLDTLNGTLVLTGGEGAIVSITDPAQPLRTEIYTPVGGVDLEIDAVTPPAQPGIQDDGVLRGAVAFEAAGVVIEQDTTTHTIRIVGPASETTLRVYVEFETAYYEWLYGRADVTLTMAGMTSSIGNIGSAARIDGITHLRFTALGAPVNSGTQERVLTETQIDVNSAGTVTIQGLDGDTFDPTSRPDGNWSYATLYPAEQNVLRPEDLTGYGYSTDGAFVFEEYTPPGSHTFGMMRGTSSVVYELRDPDNNPTGETFEVTTEFAYPIQPLCGLFPSCEEAANRRLVSASVIESP